MNTLRIIFFFAFSSFAFNLTFSQNFIQFDDGVGISIDANGLDSLEAKSTILLENLKLFDDSLEFKVLDFGYYIHQKNFQGGNGAIFNNLINSVNNLYDQYLLFGREVSQDGTNQKLHVYLKFNDSFFECINTNSINEYLGKLVENRPNQLGNRIWELEKEIIKELDEILFEGLCCSEFLQSGNKGLNKSFLSTSFCGVDDGLAMEAYLLLGGSQTFYKIIQLIEELNTFLDSCQVQNWEQFQRGGIIPHCIWKDAGPKVTSATGMYPMDIATICGVIDGVSTEIVGLYDLLKLVSDGSTKIPYFVYASAYYILVCNDIDINSPTFFRTLELLYEDPLNIQEYQNVKPIYDLFYLTNIQGFARAVFGYSGLIRRLLELIKPLDCDQLEAAVDKMYDFIFGVADLSILDSIISAISSELDTMWVKFSNHPESAESRYWVGFYLTKGVSLCVGLAEIKALGATKSLFQKGLNAIKNGKKKLFFRKVNDDLASHVLKQIRNKSWYKNLGKYKNQFDRDFGSNYNALKRFDNGELSIEGWKKLADVPGISGSINFVEISGKFLDEGIELSYKAFSDGARVLNKNGDEVARLVKNSSDEFFEISDDFFVSSGTPKSLGQSNIISNTGEEFVNPGFVNVDGSIGFVEDVSGYGTLLVQNTIKQRGNLRKSLIGIKKSEDAHHLFPVQTLKENQWVKKGVEGGFEFNTEVNGIAVEKFVKATGSGRHGPHPKLTDQINDHMNWWSNQIVNGKYNRDLSPEQTAEYMRALSNSMKNKINTTNVKLNDLDLGLLHE